MGQLSVNHPSARKYWSSVLSLSSFQNSEFYKMGLLKAKGEGDESAVIVKMDELVAGKKDGKRSGYEIDYDLEGPLFIKPTAGDNPIKGKEAKLSLFTDKIQINQDRVSIIDDGKFADGLVPYEFRERAKNRLSNEQWPLYFDERVIAKLAGALGDGTWQTIDNTKPTASARDIDGSVSSDGNDLRAPSSNRVVYGNNKASQSLITTSDLLSLDVIDQAILAGVRPAANLTNRRIVPPVMIGGRRAYVMLVDYVVLQAMNANTSGRFYDIERAKVQGGMKDSQLLDFTAYVYKSPMGVDVYLIAHPNLVKFSAATTGGQKVVRNLLLGQSALRVAYGREAKDIPQFSWHEETDDRGNQLVVTTGTTIGFQKCAYTTSELGTTREDWGVIAVDTYGNW